MMWLFLVSCAFAAVFADENRLDRAYFTAAVFEKVRQPIVDEIPYEEIPLVNLKSYARAAEEASKRDADIIVFPEFGIVPYLGRERLLHLAETVPHPDKKINPCEQPEVWSDKSILFVLSCIAKENGMYVAANLVDKHPCSDQSNYCDAITQEGCQSTCPPDGFLMYNTDVAFDRSGTLIGRYHKNHPYFEELNVPDEPEYATFKTEFGTFGMIVCFDSVFQHTINVIQHGVQHLLFLTHWFDDIVPLNAIEWQQSIAIANNINFIASNNHNPGWGTIGSGIYTSKHGALSYTYDPDGKSKLVYARIPLDDDEEEVLPDGETEVVIIDGDEVEEEEEHGEHFPLQCYVPLVGPPKENNTDYRCFKAQLERYTLKKLEPGTHDLKVCSNGFCCQAKYSAPSLTEDYYLAAFNGTNDVKSYYKWQEENCFIVRCDSFDGKDCMLLPSRAKTVFESVELKATTTCERTYPAVSTDRYRLVPKKDWYFEKDGGNVVLGYDNESNEPLLKIGFMGRCYSRDPPFVPAYRYPYGAFESPV